MDPINFITGSVIDSAMRIHAALGPGLFESVYEVVLERDLVRRGFRVERQKALQVRQPLGKGRAGLRSCVLVLVLV
jgi:GxxExxY protein